MNAVNPVLAKKLGISDAAPAVDADDAPSTPMRMMRRAMARAADAAVGLSSAVLDVAEDSTDLENLIENAPQGWVVLGLREDGHAGLTGLMLLDPALRSALVEMQTMGSLLPPAAEPRPITRVDGVMTVPFCTRLLVELAEAGFATGGVPLSRYEIGPMEDARTTGLVMAQGTYRSWRVAVQLGGSEHQTELFFAVLPEMPVDAAPTRSGDTWSAALRGAVAEAPTELDAVLGSIRLPIGQIEAFEVGQILTLPGTTVGSVMLKGPGGKNVAPARLGQVAGKRAVRLERTEVELQPDAPPISGTGATTQVEQTAQTVDATL